MVYSAFTGFLETQRGIRDYLTGLLNRQQIDAFIQTRIRDHGEKGDFGLIMIDMDDVDRRMYDAKKRRKTR